MFSSKGRIRRTEYVLSWMFSLLLLFDVFIFLIKYYENDTEVGNGGFFVLFASIICLSIFLIIQTNKRCHDINRSGWFQLIPYFNLVLFFLGGTQGSNNYGEDPRGEITAWEALNLFFKGNILQVFFVVILSIIIFVYSFSNSTGKSRSNTSWVDTTDTSAVDSGYDGSYPYSKEDVW